MAQTKTKGGPVKVRKVEIEMPEAFYDLMQKICETQGVSASDYIVNSMVDVIGGDLEIDLGYHLGLGNTPGPRYRKYVASLARPEEEVEEAQV